MRDDDDGPDATVSIEVGICGVVLFSIIFMLTTYSVRCAKNKYSWRMFFCSSVMALFDLPRYISLIVHGAYDSRFTYIIHMFASVAFFIAFTCVVYIMHDAVDLSQSHSPLATMITSPKNLLDRIVLDKTALFSLNLIFASITFMACVSCALYENLSNYFHESITYAIFTLSDVIKNLLVAFVFTFYGCRLKMRINVFYDTVGISPTGGDSPAELELLLKLKSVVRRLLIVMALCMGSFLLRTIMLVIKGICVEQDNVCLAWLPSYGMLWWVLSDFIPRGVPILSFVYFFGGRVRPKGPETSDKSRLLCGSLRQGLCEEGDHHENRQALLTDFDSDEDGENPERDYDDGFSSQDGGSGHYFQKIPHSRMSTSSAESYETTSSGHTVYRNTATTNEFSSSYRPRTRNTRKSESSNYFTGSVIVNALMWPIGSSNNPYRSSSTLSQASSAGNLADPALLRVGEIPSPSLENTETASTVSP